MNVPCTEPPRLGDVHRECLAGAAGPVPRGEGAEAQRMNAKQIETCTCVDPSLPVWFCIMTFEAA